MKIHWSIRIAAFSASVFALSVFFAGWRELMEHGELPGVALLSAGVFSTALLLMVQGYWIYFEEKSKGTLRRHVRLFEAIHTFAESHCDNKIVRMLQPVLCTEKGKSEQ